MIEKLLYGIIFHTAVSLLHKGQKLFYFKEITFDTTGRKFTGQTMILLKNRNETVTIRDGELKICAVKG